MDRFRASYPNSPGRVALSQPGRALRLVIFDALLATITLLAALMLDSEALSDGWVSLFLISMFSALSVFGLRFSQRISVDFTAFIPLSALLLLDYTGAVVIVAIGTFLALSIRAGGATRFGQTITPRIFVEEFFACVGSYGPISLLAVGMFTLLDVELPINELEIVHLVPLLIVLPGYALALQMLHLVRQWLHNPASWTQVTPQPTLAAFARQLLPLPLAVLLLIARQPDPVVHLLIVAAAITGGIVLIQYTSHARRVLERRLDELTTLNRIGQAITANLSLDDLLQTIYEQVQKSREVTVFYIALYDNTTSQISFPFVIQDGERLTWPARAPRTGLTEYVIRTREPLLLPDQALERMTARGIELIGTPPVCYVGVPMLMGDRVLGVIALQHMEGEHVYGPADVELLSTVAAQAASAVQNALTYSQTDATLRDRVIELSAIEVVSRRMAMTFDFEDIINDVLAAAMSTMDAAIGSCALVTEDDAFVLVAHLDAHGTPFESSFKGSINSQGIIGRTLRTQQTVIVADTTQDPDYISLVDGMRSELCVPIMREDRAIGVLNFEDPRVSAFNESHIRFVNTLAEHAAIAIENARLFHDRRRQIETLTSLRALSLHLLAALHLQPAVDAIVAHAYEIAHARYVRLYLPDAANDTLYAASHYTVAGFSTAALFPPSEHVRQVAETGQAYHSLDVQALSVYRALTPVPDFEATVCIPLRRAQHVLGVLEIAFSDPRYYTVIEIQALEVLANQAAVAIENTRLYEVVQAGRDQLQATLNSTHEAMLLFDMHGRLLRANSAAETMLGQSLQPFLGQSFGRWVRRTASARVQELTGHTPQQLRQYLQDVMDDPSQTTRRQFQQVRGEEVHYIDEIGTPVRDQDGAAAGWLLVWRDITEEHELDKLRNELSSMIVHDLRSPLTAVISSLTMFEDLLQDEETDIALFDEVLQIAQNSAYNMLNLVQSLLDVARLEQNRMILDCESLSLTDSIQIAAETIFSLATRANIDVHIDIPDDLPPVWIDDEKIQRVLSNLLDNALRHTPTNGYIRVHAAPHASDEAVLVCITDTGPGIPPEARHRIFDKFAQLDQQALRGHKGTGLGLTFCKLAVEAHGGAIWVDEGAEGGAAFCFTLPVTSSGERIPPHHA
ncbi:MAG: GAF domain-containing protein [Chloroflexi bacterium]|nr:GAF domain-containing protein [Chloroflexota bacterium]